MSRLANLRKGDNYLISEIDAYGSRAGSTFRGRGPNATSDLDLMIDINKKYLDDPWVNKVIDNIQSDFKNSTGFPLQIKSNVVMRNFGNGNFTKSNLYKR